MLDTRAFLGFLPGCGMGPFSSILLGSAFVAAGKIIHGIHPEGETKINTTLHLHRVGHLFHFSRVGSERKLSYITILDELQ